MVDRLRGYLTIRPPADIATPMCWSAPQLDGATNLGASAIEGYPVTDAATGRRSQLSSGTVDMFSRNGFRMVGPPTGRRAVMRRRSQ